MKLNRRFCDRFLALLFCGVLLLAAVSVNDGRFWIINTTAGTGMLQYYHSGDAAWKRANVHTSALTVFGGLDAKTASLLEGPVTALSSGNFAGDLILQSELILLSGAADAELSLTELQHGSTGDGSMFVMTNDNGSSTSFGDDTFLAGDVYLDPFSAAGNRTIFFGGATTVTESLLWNNASGRFDFSDPIYTAGYARISQDIWVTGGVTVGAASSSIDKAVNWEGNLSIESGAVTAGDISLYNLIENNTIWGAVPSMIYEEDDGTTRAVYIDGGNTQVVDRIYFGKTAEELLVWDGGEFDLSDDLNFPNVDTGITIPDGSSEAPQIIAWGAYPAFDQDHSVGWVIGAVGIAWDASNVIYFDFQIPSDLLVGDVEIDRIVIDYDCDAGDYIDEVELEESQLGTVAWTGIDTAYTTNLTGSTPSQQQILTADVTVVKGARYRLKVTTISDNGGIEGFLGFYVEYHTE